MDIIAEGSTYYLHSNGRRLSSPQGHVLEFPSRALAELGSKGACNGPAHQIANARFDVPLAHMRDALIAYAHGETLCYRANTPHELVVRQNAQWDRWLDWVREKHGLAFTYTYGVMPMAPPADTLVRLNRLIDDMSPFMCTGIHAGAHITGSLILSLALAAQAGDAETIHQCAALDVLYQIETWGEDEDIRADLEMKRLEIETLVRYFTALTE